MAAGSMTNSLGASIFEEDGVVGGGKEKERVCMRDREGVSV